MMTLTRGEIEILLDSPDQTNYVVSAFADLTVQDGFRDPSSRNAQPGARPPPRLSEAEARKALDANIEVDPPGVREEVDPDGQGARRLRLGRPGPAARRALDFPVENRLVIDEEPFLLPLARALARRAVLPDRPGRLATRPTSSRPTMAGRGVRDLERPDVARGHPARQAAVHLQEAVRQGQPRAAPRRRGRQVPEGGRRASRALAGAASPG